MWGVGVCVCGGVFVYVWGCGVCVCVWGVWGVCGGCVGVCVCVF